MTALLKPSIFSDSFPLHHPLGDDIGQEFVCTMCDDELVNGKKTLDPEPPQRHVSSGAWLPSIPTYPKAVPVVLPVSLKRHNPSPKPLGSHIEVVEVVTVSTDQDLLKNKDSVLECLSPLLDKSDSTQDTNEHYSQPTKKRRIASTRRNSGESSTQQDNDTHTNDDEDDATDMGQGSSANEEDDVGLTDHQAAMWTKRFGELVGFREKFGHCLVPHKWSENLALATWVKRQRYQWKLREQGKRSTLTKERRDALDNLGFVWDSHNAIWEERFNELVEFKRTHGHTSVPSTHKNHSLSVWVQCQRRQWKLLKEETGSKDSVTFRMKQNRVDRLEALGFVWEPRKHHTNIPLSGKKSS